MCQWCARQSINSNIIIDGYMAVHLPVRWYVHMAEQYVNGRSPSSSQYHSVKAEDGKEDIIEAEILAKEIGRLMDIPVDTESLIRNKNTIPQKVMDARGRRKNLQHAFAWKGMKLQGVNVLLIDDIYTTGSTIDVAAKTVRLAGAEKVHFLTVSIGQGT